MKNQPKPLFTRANGNLLSELVRAQFKLIDHNSLLGFLWSFLGPLTMLMVTYAIFSARFGKGIPAYPLYLLFGIVMVNFFVNTTFQVMQFFYGAIPMILNTPVRREILLVSYLGVPLYKFLLELICCVVLSVVLGKLSLILLILALPVMISFIGFILGVSALLTLANCFARDVGYLWMLVSRVLFFITPIFYQLKDLSSWARALVYYGNPLTPYVVSLRGLLMGSFDAASYGHSLLTGIFFLALGYGAFSLLGESAMERA